jgi:hypothetical protein
MRGVQRLAAIAVVAIALVGCGGSKPLHASAAKEQAWVSSTQDWLAVESFDGNFRGCDRRLAHKVGPSPARDLQPLDSAVGRMCADFARAYRDLDAAFKRNDADLYQRSQKEMHRAEAQIVPVRALVDEWHPGSSGGLPTKGGEVESSRIEPRLSAAASAVARTPVTVRCWSKDDWPRISRVARAEGAGAVVAELAGLADPVAETIDLSPEGCRDLVMLTYGGIHSGTSVAFGITLLAHEATHLREDAGSSEAVTECFAMQRVVEAAPKLGVGVPEARLLARTYWEELYPEDLPEYVTPDCRNNGPFDLHPGDSRWP